MQITSDVALSVVNDLLDTAKLEAGVMNLSIKECPGLIETMTQSVRIFADKAGRKELDLIMQPSKDLEDLDKMLQQGSVVWTDCGRLQQVVMNLIGNAVKFTPSGKILISCSLVKNTGNTPKLNSGNDATFRDEPQNGALKETMKQSDGQKPRITSAQIPPDASVTHSVFRIEVSDTGIGIDSDFLKNHIFKSFAQYDQSMTRRFGGTGLGLAISKHLVMMNGGILGVTSKVGQGSTFYFTWPITIVGPSQSRFSQRPRSVLHQQYPSAKITLSSDIAMETRAVVVEPVAESRNLMSHILTQQNVNVTLYETCDNVILDEKNRSSTLFGPDGSILITNYRPNAHFYFCIRPSNAEIVVETARGLGKLFQQRNQDAKSKDSENSKDIILSIILIVFSSPKGRSLANDLMDRIRDGLENTIHCRYIMKPITPDRVVECLQTIGSHAPFTRGPIYNRKAAVESFSISPSNRQKYDRIQQWRVNHANSQADEALIDLEATRENVSNSNSKELHKPQDRMVSADNVAIKITSVDELNNGGNRNTPEPPRYKAVEDTENLESHDNNVHNRSINDVEEVEYVAQQKPEVQSDQQVTVVKPQPRKAFITSLAMQRKLRKKSVSEGATKGALADEGVSVPKVIPESSGDSLLSSSQVARAAASKRERKGKCILCVEDNIINLRVIQYQLQKLGYDTQSACDGQVAVDMIKAQVEMHNQESESALTSAHLDGNNGLCITGAQTNESINDLDSLQDPQQMQIGSPSQQWNILNGLLMIPECNEYNSPSVSPDRTMVKELTSSVAQADTDVNHHKTMAAAAMLKSASPRPSSVNLSKQQPGKPNKIDLILMDCAMPVKSGFEAASEIRTMGQNSIFAANIPIIALTASGVHTTKNKCIASGMNGFLSKPTKLGDLEAMLNQWINV
ncbi:hypothetical protein BGZ46_008576 [Entomortierella lignicola]|nr:hypothetical protein BGZ46_008576 [Entomortierella lignicola]